MTRDRVPVRLPASIIPRGADPDEVPIEIDALRGDLYRLLDRLARAAPNERGRLFESFESVWSQFKEAITAHL